MQHILGPNVRFLTNVIFYFNEHTGHLEILLTQSLIELRLGCDLRIRSSNKLPDEANAIE